MNKIALIAVMLAAPVAAQDIPGLVSARLLPGWVEDGQRYSALELVLEPGWKTYWRSPGDGGIPPDFEWLGGVGTAGDDGPGADGMADDEVTFYWPRPEVFYAGGMRSVGYHDQLLLPFSFAHDDAAGNGPLAARVFFGLCREVCVPATVELEAGAPAIGEPDRRIADTIASQPAVASYPITCQIAPTEDGLEITAYLPAAAGSDASTDDQPGTILAEFIDSSIWVSEASVTQTTDGIAARFEAVAPTGAPFVVEEGAIRVTHLWDGGAVEYRTCLPTGSAPD